MKLLVKDISSISHMIYHNGKPCNKYTATVGLVTVGAIGYHRYYLCLYARTEAVLERKLDRYRTDELIDIPVEDLIDKRGRKYGQA